MPSKVTVEGIVLAICAIIAFRKHVPGGGVVLRLQLFGVKFARRRALACISVAVLALTVRAVLLPIWQVPRPSIYDEFSYLLQADIFAHGRLTNPAHPMWPFFESVYVLQQPTYASKYPPGQAVAMGGTIAVRQRLVWCLAELWGARRCPVLGVAGVAPSGVGIFGVIHRS
jgi:hypothetical protein